MWDSVDQNNRIIHNSSLRNHMVQSHSARTGKLYSNGSQAADTKPQFNKNKNKYSNIREIGIKELMN